MNTKTLMLASILALDIACGIYIVDAMRYIIKTQRQLDTLDECLRTCEALLIEYNQTTEQ